MNDEQVALHLELAQLDWEAAMNSSSFEFAQLNAKLARNHSNIAKRLAFAATHSLSEED